MGILDKEFRYADLFWGFANWEWFFSMMRKKPGVFLYRQYWQGTIRYEDFHWSYKRKLFVYSHLSTKLTKLLENWNPGRLIYMRFPTRLYFVAQMVKYSILVYLFRVILIFCRLLSKIPGAYLLRNFLSEVFIPLVYCLPPFLKIIYKIVSLISFISLYPFEFLLRMHIRYVHKIYLKLRKLQLVVRHYSTGLKGYSKLFLIAKNKIITLIFLIILFAILHNLFSFYASTSLTTFSYFFHTPIILAFYYIKTLLFLLITNFYYLLDYIYFIVHSAAAQFRISPPNFIYQFSAENFRLTLHRIPNIFSYIYYWLLFFYPLPLSDFTVLHYRHSKIDSIIPLYQIFPFSAFLSTIYFLGIVYVCLASSERFKSLLIFIPLLQMFTLFTVIIRVKRTYVFRRVLRIRDKYRRIHRRYDAMYLRKKDAYSSGRTGGPFHRFQGFKRHLRLYRTYVRGHLKATRYNPKIQIWSSGVGRKSICG